MRSACNLENHCCDLNVTIKRTGEYNNWYMIYIGLLGITYSLSYRTTTLKLITFENFYLLWCTDLKLVNIINLFWFLSVIVFLILLLIFNLIFCLLLTWLADCQDADCQDTWTLPLVLWLISKHGEMVHVWSHSEGYFISSGICGLEFLSSLLCIFCCYYQTGLNLQTILLLSYLEVFKDCGENQKWPQRLTLETKDKVLFTVMPACVWKCFWLAFI